VQLIAQTSDARGTFRNGSPVRKRIRFTPAELVGRRERAPHASNHRALLRAVRFLGVDLAWGEGSEDRPANYSGVVALGAWGEIHDAGWTIGLDETQAWIERHALETRGSLSTRRW
jgi:hypothetical protein